ncbi:Uncharacterised protein [Lysinibacillus capsici]|uniref:Uncharacterized protein n=1 Tax=Lysinibacillus capsici TaxID=2115968 RepID=A0A2X0ZY43_9BACI|nr:hypothetical protein [Lysinibacillus capsici]SPU37903.1 Uncharacterised protein [Lysinibacillus capsici]
MLEKLKDTVTPKGITVEEYLKSKWPNGEWIVEKDSITYNANYQHLNVLYKWSVKGDSLEIVGGKAADLTPQYDVRLQEINEKKKMQDPNELKIFEHVQKYEQDFETKEAIKKVSEEIGVNADEVLDIYDKVSRAIYL